MSSYHGAGHSYLVCPRLLELDERHGEHWSKHPTCRVGGDCIREHEHEEPLPHGAGHSVADFHWLPGCRPPTAEEHPRCGCGAALVWTDGHDLYAAEHLAD